jgi:hypothetical protein
MRFLRWSAVPELIRSFGDRTVPFFGLGLFIAALGLIVAVLLSLILIVLPLLGLSSGRAGGPRTLIYFGGLGLGYFFVEIVFIQRFTLFLGHPVYAATAVIASMLIGSGIGSYFSSRLKANPSNVAKAALLVSVLVLLYIVVLDQMFDHAISLPLRGRAVIALLLILPPAFAMGFPFPLGLKFLGSIREQQLAWAWAVNGCLSVVGAASATLIALELGFTVVLLTAASVYGMAALIAILSPPEMPRSGLRPHE